jgi:hypothetical protein
MPAAVPLIGAAASVGGSLLSSHAQKKAAKSAAAGAAFNPYSTSNLFGSTTWDNNNKALTQSLSPWAQGLAGNLQDQAMSSSANPFGGFADSLKGQGAGDVGAAYSGAQNYGGLSPDFINQIMGGFAGLQNQGPQFNLGGLARQSSNNPFSREMINTGRGLLNQDYGDVAQKQLDLMRQDAQPQEQQQTNDLFQRLYGQGRLDSTGGGMDITAFAKGLGQADTQRQLSAMNFAQGLRSSDQQLGANLFNSGNNSYLQGIGQAGQLGSTINSQDTARNQLGLQALLGAQNFGTSLDNTGYSRANDRVARASDLFGFGNSIDTSNNANTASILQLLSGLSGQQNQLAQLGLSSGGASAQAGATQGQFTMGAAGSPLGGLFQGLGGGLLGSQQGQDQLSGLFGKLFGTGGSMNTSDQNIANSFYPPGG